MKNKKAFVLMETIVVIAVLDVIMISLYAGYASLLMISQKKSHYDNTEYIYKANFVKRELGYDLQSGFDTTKGYTIICSDDDQGIENASECGSNDLLNTLHVKAIYIFPWYLEGWTYNEHILATTQKYIKTLNTTHSNDYRLIVMFEEENSISNDYRYIPTYEYASLRIKESDLR